MTLFAASITLAASGAEAHDWYAKTGCCGGDDCGPAEDAWVQETPDGYRVRMTLEQSRKINSKSTAPVDAFVAHKNVKIPPVDLPMTNKYDVCIWQSDRTAPQGGIICFFKREPPGS